MSRPGGSVPVGGSCVATAIPDHDQAQLVPAPSPDPRSSLVLNTYLDSDRLIGLAQPTVWSELGMETARKALSAAHSALHNARYLADLTTANRLRRALTAANDVVIDANLSRAGNEHDTRVGVGIALCLRSGRNAVIALNPPVQILLFQGGAATWYPRRDSWVGSDNGLTGGPLGWTAQAQPSFVTTIVDHGDEILLTTAQVAAALATTEREPTNPGHACDVIAAMANDRDIDPIEVVALSTRFEPPSLTGNVRSVARQAISSVDRRARAVWTALRTAQPVHNT
jgi:hypothetical protein